MPWYHACHPSPPYKQGKLQIGESCLSLQTCTLFEKKSVHFNLQLCAHQWCTWLCFVCATFLFLPHFLKQFLWYRTEEMYGNLELICLSDIRHSQFALVAFFFLVFVDWALWKQEGQSFPWCLGKTSRSAQWKICCCCWVS